MKMGVKLPIPVVRRLRKLGSDIKDARRRRRITVALMAERSGLSWATIGRIEKGDPASSMGAYSAVLFVLGMEEGLALLVDAARDVTGRRLEDEKLPKRVRIPRNKEGACDWSKSYGVGKIYFYPRGDKQSALRIMVRWGLNI